jgi:hypothetical protein
MLCLQNDLGWRLEKVLGAYVVRKSHPPLRRRVMQVGPALINVALVVCLWLGRVPTTFLFLCVIAVLLLLWFPVRRRFGRCMGSMIPGLVMFAALVARDDITAEIALYCIPATLVIGALGFRPMVLAVSPRYRLVTLGDLTTRMAFSSLRIEIDVFSGAGRYQVFLRNTEQSRKESELERDKWEVLSWESESEAEASHVADQLRSLGVGTEDPKRHKGVALANKKARTLFMAGHIAAVGILIILVFCVTRRYDMQVEEDQLQAILRVFQLVIAFVFLSIIPFAVYLGRLGWRAAKYRRMPPPGTTIIMNTKILDGDLAVRRGRMFTSVAFVLFALALVGALLLPYVLGKVPLENIFG